MVPPQAYLASARSPLDLIETGKVWGKKGPWRKGRPICEAVEIDVDTGSLPPRRVCLPRLPGFAHSIYTPPARASAPSSSACIATKMTQQSDLIISSYSIHDVRFPTSLTGDGTDAMNKSKSVRTLNAGTQADSCL